MNSFEYLGLSYRKTSDNTVSVSGLKGMWGDRGKIIIPSTVTAYAGKEFNVTGVDRYAFHTVLSATELVIPGSVVEISEAAFESCVSLKDVTIGEGVQILRYNAFCRCKGLNEIYIPASVSTIEEGAFNECLFLERIIVNQANANFCSIDGSLYSKDKTELVLCAPAKKGTLRIPSTVRNIRPTALEWSLQLESVEVEDGSESFRSIDGLLYDKDVTRLIYCPEGRSGSVIIADSVKTIGKEAFLFTENIKKITIPEGLEEIEWGGFSGCSILHSIVLPAELKVIGNDAFHSSCHLDSITIHAKTPPDCSSGSVFCYSAYKNATLYVPRGTKAAYSSAPEWKEFKDIVEMDLATEECKLEDGTISINLLKREVIIKGLDCEVIVSSSTGQQIYKMNINGGSSVIHVPQKHSCELKAGNSSLKIMI